MSIHFLPAAEAEINEITGWYELRKPGLALDFANELDRALEVIENAPLAWPLWPRLRPALGIRRFLLDRFPYALPYRIEQDGTIGVYAVAHVRRRPMYWVSRLE